MTLFRYGGNRWLGFGRGLLLVLALTAVIAVAMVGAVIGLAVLAAGAVLHALISVFRAQRAPRASAGVAAPGATAPRVIEGEFVVIDRGHG